MNYIISGSRGLIGEKLKERLDKAGHKCVLEIDLRKGSNILNINDMDFNIQTQPVDIFFHLGASCRIAETIKNPRLANSNNANGTFECLEFCRLHNIKKFVYMSSSRTLSSEENPYTASKKYGEHLCEAYRQCYGIEFLIIRPSTVYGECHDLTTRLLTKWVINAMKGEPLILYGDPETKTLDFTHVDDFVEGIGILLKNWSRTKNRAFDICGDDCRKLSDVAMIIRDEMDKYPVETWPKGSYFQLDFAKPETAQPQQVKIDIGALKEYGYKPKIKLEEGIKRLVAFYKGDGKKWITN